MQSNLHILSRPTWFLVLFNVLLFHSLQFVPDVFGLLVMFGMELEGYNFNLILYFFAFRSCAMGDDDILQFCQRSAPQYPVLAQEFLIDRTSGTDVFNDWNYHELKTLHTV